LRTIFLPGSQSVTGSKTRPLYLLAPAAEDISVRILLEQKVS